ncbi:nudix hydrolase 2-like [Malania oleifera]|uniref:nudix hydrolase 2-like n=1 Tax=Malania oleifera TaxID=397392 RepID=UPI0025AE2EB1|nr:nudix hydrolase 2-like [Malania oleifera]
MIRNSLPRSLLPMRTTICSLESSSLDHRRFFAHSPNNLIVPRKSWPSIFSSRRMWTEEMKIGAGAGAGAGIRTMAASIIDEVQQVKLLAAENDDHGGVIVDLKGPMDSSVFVELLRGSISHWRQQGKKGVWIKLPLELVNLVEPAVKEGFWYHHAERKYVMLVYWIPESADTLPANASHRVGIGAFVMNEKREVLVVQEKSGIFQGTGVWKFPTGVVDEGENICEAAVREVREEAGIDAKFLELLAFRQSHKSFFEKSDLFFVCMLQPLSFNIKKQESEIEAAQWMPFEEYATQPFVQSHDLLKRIADMCWAKIEGKYSGFCAVPTSSSFSSKNCYLYLSSQGLNGS